MVRSLLGRRDADERNPADGPASLSQLGYECSTEAFMRSSSGSPATSGHLSRDSEVVSRVQRVIDAIRPAVQSDGGDLELVGVTEGGTVQIRLHGACVGCPSSMMTLKVGVERNLKDHVPEVVCVEAVA